MRRALSRLTSSGVGADDKRKGLRGPKTAQPVEEPLTGLHLVLVLMLGRDVATLVAVRPGSLVGLIQAGRALAGRAAAQAHGRGGAYPRARPGRRATGAERGARRAASRGGAAEAQSGRAARARATAGRRAAGAERRAA